MRTDGGHSSGTAIKLEAIARYECIIFDFDGVIKESVEAKADAFAALFAPFGPDLVGRVRAHHGVNGGVSRFEKIPLYLSWAGQPVTPENVRAYCDRFAELAHRAVIDSEWVPGAERFLRTNPYSQTFVVVSATPQEELEQILSALSLSDSFKKIIGAPTQKSVAVQSILKELGLQPESAVVIGDSTTDLKAAEKNGVPFLLRKSSQNEKLFADYDGLFVRSFDEIPSNESTC